MWGGMKTCIHPSVLGNFGQERDLNNSVRYKHSSEHFILGTEEFLNTNYVVCLVFIVREGY